MSAAGSIKLIIGPMFSRKCFAPSTKVMTFDGLSCEMSDVRAGDMLMGDDSGYRVVEEVSSGTDDMYAIEMDSGERLYVNSVHIVTVLGTAARMVRNPLHVPQKHKF
jgi:Hom_end-associated Hint